jgi:hypothetical protein
MKKIFTILSLFVITLVANAQEAKKSDFDNPKVQAATTVRELGKIVTISEQLHGDLSHLLVMRNEAMTQVTTPEDKKAVFTKYGKKFMAAFSTGDQEKIKAANPSIYNSIVEYKEEK